MKFRFVIFMLLAALLLCPAGSLWAEQDELTESQLKEANMNPEGPVLEFLEKENGALGEKIQEKIGNGSVDPNNPESLVKELGKEAKGILARSIELRKTIKEPTQRLILDMEMVTLGSQSGLVNEVIAVISNWKGDMREAMIITAAQRFQMMKIPMNAEFDALLKELGSSKDPQIVKAAERMLNPFFRNPEGHTFPAFPDGKKTIDGKDLNLERFKGKVLLVDFWATWCPPCVAEVGSLVSAYNKYKDKGFEIVGISFDKEREAFDKFAKENKMDWVHYYDGKYWENEVGPTYGIQSIPTMYLLDREGKVITTDLRSGKLEKELEKLLK
ncbi:MAG: TlpA family protein disulfide reductase [Candidatus Riflebacteria bacterium]|nr:TlpA family protein disulfide reductase [Candidatus Riflebacteria bacterium]